MKTEEKIRLMELAQKIAPASSYLGVLQAYRMLKAEMEKPNLKLETKNPKLKT